jgi:hypothetical protein
MRRLLKPHPDSRCRAAIRIEVGIARPRADGLVLSYVVNGKMSDIRLPAAVPPARSDGLWKHTCFEAFVRASSGAEYYEFNFSPSTQWAAYRFSGYRSGRRVAAEIDAPPMEVQLGPGCYTLKASLAFDCLSGLPRQAAWRLGLSALIEDTGGRKSYWALAHPPGKPDFHHADCFAHEFSPAAPS